MASSEYWKKRMQTEEFQEFIKKQQEDREKRRQREEKICEELDKYGIERAKSTSRNPLETRKVYTEKLKQELFLLQKGCDLIDESEQKLEKRIRSSEKRFEQQKRLQECDIKSHYMDRPMD